MEWGYAYGFPSMSEEDPPLVEITTIRTVFMTGSELETMDGLITLTAWEKVGTERRVVARLAMPRSAAHALMTALRRELGHRGADH